MSPFFPRQLFFFWFNREEYTQISLVGRAHLLKFFMLSNCSVNATSTGHLLRITASVNAPFQLRKCSVNAQVAPVLLGPGPGGTLRGTCGWSHRFKSLALFHKGPAHSGHKTRLLVHSSCLIGLPQSYGAHQLYAGILGHFR